MSLARKTRSPGGLLNISSHGLTRYVSTIAVASDRGILFDEFQQKLGEIDRSEARPGSYHLTDEGVLQLDPTPDELPDWEDERRAAHANHVRLCTERGGVIVAAFDLQPSGHQVMVGVVVLDGEWIGQNGDMLDMYLLFASRSLKPGRFVNSANEGSTYRDAGIGALRRVAAPPVQSPS